MLLLEYWGRSLAPSVRAISAIFVLGKEPSVNELQKSGGSSIDDKGKDPIDDLKCRKDATGNPQLG